MDLITARKKLETYGQEHLLRYYDTLTEAEKASLLSEIEATDFSVLEAFGKASEAALPDQKFEPLPAVTIAEIAAHEEEFREAGLKAIRECRTGAVLLAGGQGTRLGFDHPKGMYNMGLTKDLYIFECHIKRLLKVSEEAGALIPLYVMNKEVSWKEKAGYLALVLFLSACSHGVSPRVPDLRRSSRVKAGLAPSLDTVSCSRPRCTTPGKVKSHSSGSLATFTSIPDSLASRAA